jgi:hypothetical protein
LAPDLLGEGLDEPAVCRTPPDQGLADRWRRRECLRNGQRPLLIVALEVGALPERDEHEADEGARQEDPDHAGQDAG